MQNIRVVLFTGISIFHKKKKNNNTYLRLYTNAFPVVYFKFKNFIYFSILHCNVYIYILCLIFWAAYFMGKKKSNFKYIFFYFIFIRKTETNPLFYTIHCRYNIMLLIIHAYYKLRFFFFLTKRMTNQTKPPYTIKLF